MDVSTNDPTDTALGAAEGLTRDDLLGLYRVMALARALDERMWILNRSGRVAFVISGQGHEGAQAGITWALRAGSDWLAPYYRSITACLQFGMTPREIMLGSYARAGDPSSGAPDIDTPLTESMIVGVSIGAAVNGLRPVAEIQFADFIFPAFNQLQSQAARMRYRTNNAVGLPMTIRAPYGGGVHGALYHSQSVEAFFTHIPGIKVVVPSTPLDARGLLRSAIRDPDPVLFLEHKKLYRSVRGDVPDTDYVTPLGSAAITRPGTQVTVIAYGLMAHHSLEAAGRVAEEGISVEVIDLRSLRPLDTETVLNSVRKTGKCLIVYEDNRFGGYGAEIAALVAEEAFEYLDGPVVRIAGPDVPGVPYNHVLEEWFMVNPDKIAAGIRRLAAY